MLVKMKRLRRAGARLHNRDIAQQPTTEGELTLYALGSVYVLDVRDPNNNTPEGVRARLYEAQATTMHGDKMLFKGLERPQGDDGPEVVQEWSVVLVR